MHRQIEMNMKRARCQLAMREYFDIPEKQKKYSGIRLKEMHFTSKNSCSKQLITSIEIKFENFLQTCCRIQNLKESQKTENAFSEKKKNGLIMQPSFQVTDSAISGVISWTCCVVLLVVVPFKIYYFTVYYCCGFGLIIIGHPKGRPLFLSLSVSQLVCHSKKLRKCPTSFFYKNSFLSQKIFLPQKIFSIFLITRRGDLCF